MENSIAESVGELQKKIEELELIHARLKHEMSELLNSSPAHRITLADRHQKQRSSPLERESRNMELSSGGGEGVGPPMNCLNILESMGRSVHVTDTNNRIMFWNRMAENVFGYSPAEALGMDVIELLADSREIATTYKILHGVMMGESWTGLFPVRTRNGDRLSILATYTPLYDNDGTIVSGICVSVAEKPFSRSQVFDPQQPLQEVVTFKISGLAPKVSNKVKSKMRPAESYSDHEGGSWGSHHYDLVSLDAFEGGSCKDCSPGKPSGDPGDESEVKPAISKILSSKAASRIGKKGLGWPWKGNKLDAMDPKSSHFVWTSIHNDQEHELRQQQSGPATFKSVNQVNETNRPAKKLPSDLFDATLWEDLIIGDQIGKGACGTVYRAQLYGSDVAVKVFPKQKYSDDLILSFKQEVSMMKTLRHPNILLFMGSVTSPQRLCIVSEFLPRGSLFQLLRRNSSKLEWRRRIHMAMDITQGMNYLHHCSPPIVLRDLKPSNLLVDRNWTVKVGDFGLSQLKHETFRRMKLGDLTPQWTAPEVLRNEPANEKADVYSYGVILWELVTLKIPWENLNPLQIIAAVGFKNQRLEIPKDVDLLWVPIIESCLHSEPQCRPSFQEILEMLKDLQRQYDIQMSSWGCCLGRCPLKRNFR